MRASSAEETEEAPTAKEAKHEEQIRVRARDGEEVTLSRDAARLMGTLKDLMDLATSEDGIYPLPTIMASTLQMVCKLMDPDYTWPSSDEHSVVQLIQLIEDALYLDAPVVALKHIQREIASRLNGKRAPELCALIGAGGDFGSAEKQAPPNAEPAFVPEDVEAPQQPANSTLPPEPLQQPSFSADAMEAALGLVDVATLAELKGVTRSWRALAQRVLCSRLCRRDGQPVPTRLDEITDLDVEQLIEAGRPGDAAVAGRMLPGLARLHGYGYVVDVAAQMREGGVTVLNLSNKGLQVAAAMLVAYLIPATSVVLKNCNLLKNSLDVKSATMLAKIGAEKGIMLSGMTRDQSLAYFSGQNLRPADAILIASDLKFMAVLTTLDLDSNNIGNNGAKAIAEALKVNGVLTELKLWSNKIGDEGAIAIAEALKVNAVMTTLDLGGNKIGVEGAIAIAEALKVTAILTTLSLWNNSIGDEGATAIAQALKVNAVVTSLFLGYNKIGDEGAIVIAEALKVNAVVTTLYLGGNRIGVEGAKAIAEALKVNAVLTNLDLFNNSIGAEGAIAIAKALKPAAHGHGLRRTNPPSALRVKFAMKVRKRAQQR
ncbi:hypothetical protein Ctob_004793 [Chrysochromulina tobinii]|uniref:Protein nlrc3 n=1 Tax=Chrysochromulina tobinii TaxID=1460289 RepID=A0A0M0K0R2_9EUKA|nr:hypothetical protein Ctob_004793 [Chrysochromulina tobinii]|eukprot:KOO31958.1 hypothetical protein Ctob_004793 [Chrysochromulina sp. CCMP291]